MKKQLHMKHPSCHCCGTRLTAPVYINGLPYGWSCAKKVSKTSFLKTSGVFVLAESFDVVGGEISQGWFTANVSFSLNGNPCKLSLDFRTTLAGNCFSVVADAKKKGNIFAIYDKSNNCVYINIEPRFYSGFNSRFREKYSL
jgi:hypothetical protein